jgi:AcrR family transcriptional regulator
MVQRSRAAKRAETEERIKSAARKLFTKKGYTATKTRDIAKEADVNLALLNYYFRSKDELFNIIMLENYNKFLSGIKDSANDKNTSFEDKVMSIIRTQIDMLLANPDMPIFIVNEIMTNPDQFAKKTESVFLRSIFMKQMSENAATLKNIPFDPIHLLINIMSLSVASFFIAPVVRKILGVDQLRFNLLMAERKTLIPLWIKKMAEPG